MIGISPTHYRSDLTSSGRITGKPEVIGSSAGLVPINAPSSDASDLADLGIVALCRLVGNDPHDAQLDYFRIADYPAVIIR